MMYDVGEFIISRNFLLKVWEEFILIHTYAKYKERRREKEGNLLC